MDLVRLQEIVRDRYHDADSSRGLHHTFLYLVEEVGELSTAIAQDDLKHAGTEVVDLLMWVVTVANLLDVDLEDAVQLWLDNPRTSGTK